MKRNLLIALTVIIFSGISSAQEFKKLTLENMYQNSIFKMNYIQGLKWMKDGSYYTSRV